MKPFLKWVGGKGKVVPQLTEIFPDNFNNYYEPFVGGGAVYFALNAKTATINDINKSLVGTYINIRDDLGEVISELKLIEAEYLGRTLDEQKDIFYKYRDEYNSVNDKASVRKSVLLIFLNKTCFNGMYRENRKGGYNVPFGRHHNPTICDEKNLKAVSLKLQQTSILSGSYKEAVKDAKKGDFVYFDPPYYPLNPTSSFTSYSEDDFTEKDQIELKEAFDELTARGCKVALSNSDTPFIKNLYKDYRQEKVYVGRSINATGTGRGKISELVVVNYK